LTRTVVTANIARQYQTMARIEATPTPALLTWAREYAGLTVEALAKKIGVGAEQVKSWEDGSARPTVPQLRNFARVTKRPLAVFYLPVAPHGFDALHDFRRGTSDFVEPARSPELAFEIRRANDRREWALELLSELDEPPAGLELTASIRDDPEKTAENIRTVLGITTAQQRQWRVDNEAFREWRGLLERSGVLTFQATDIELREARGFSISAKPLPVVVVNIKDAYRGRIFTLLHELTHIALNEGGVCDLDDDARENKSAQVEAYCNRVAGAALFPHDELLRTTIVRDHPRTRMEWADDEIMALAREFGGSREALLVRLLTLGRTTVAFYRHKKEEYHKAYMKWREERKGGFAPPHVVAISSAGPLFTSLVVRTLNAERITQSDVSDFLQIRVKHVPELQRDFRELTA
jgi:Zn-dependent peptidase ImmA (M78 family)/DNA-binding transcriptional regulator YiaG